MLNRVASCLAAFLVLCGASRAHAQAGRPPFVLERTMLMPGVAPGPYTDYLTIDPAGRLLFTTPQASKSVAVFDLQAQRMLRLIPGLGNPHGVAYDPATKRLFVADSDAGAVKVFEGDEFTLVRTIPLDNGVDWMIADPAKPVVYVNHGGGDARMDHSVVTAIDVNTMAAVADIRIDSMGLEQSTIDPATRRLYLDLKDKNAVVVIDLDKGAVLATWPLANSRRPFAAALDARHGRLYLGCRDTDMRGSIDVVDLETGKEVDRLPIFGWIDSIYFDAKRQRVFGSVGVGMIEAFDALPEGGYRKLDPVDTAVMSKTSLFVPGSDTFYVSVPRLGSTPAQVMVFKAAP